MLCFHELVDDKRTPAKNYVLGYQSNLGTVALFDSNKIQIKEVRTAEHKTFELQNYRIYEISKRTPQHQYFFKEIPKRIS